MDANHLSAFQKGVIIGTISLEIAFGSTVLVPLLVGLDPSTALLTAGIGTLIFHLVTSIVPHLSGNGFAFIAPIIKASEFVGMADPFRNGRRGVRSTGLWFIGKITGNRLHQETSSPIVIGR